MDDLRYIHPLDIGTVHLDNNLCLAPMAGFTNVAFRLIAKQVGNCGLVASEMVAAIGREQNFDNPKQNRRFLTQTQQVEGEHPLAMQVYGREPDLCAITARRLRERGADIIDLNCGCPVKKAKQSGCGVALMKEPQQVGAVVKAMNEAVDCPVTVKMRLGFDSASQNAVAFARIAEDNGAAALFVHGRTGENKHGTAVDIAGIAAVKEAVSIPVIANGNMDTPENIRQVKDQAGVDGYQIGRAACGDPWIFRNLQSVLSGGEVYTPSLNERRALLERHYQLICDLFGEEHGTRIMRKYTFFYCNGLPGVRKFRHRFTEIKDAPGFTDLVADFFQALQDHGAEMGPAEHLQLFDRKK